VKPAIIYILAPSW